MADTPCPVCGVRRGRLLELEKKIETLEAKLASSPAPKVDPLAVLQNFRRFWDAYPRKVGKIDATKAFEKLAPSDQEAAAAGAEALALVARRARPDRLTFLKHPATWLHGRGWEDGEEEWRRIFHLPLILAPASHPADPTPLHAVDETAPPWIQAAARTTLHASRPVIPDDIEDAYRAWRRGADVSEPPDCLSRLNEALEAAIKLDARYR